MEMKVQGIEERCSNAQPGLNEDTRLSEALQDLLRVLPFLDLTDQSQWSAPIEDPDGYFRAVFTPR